MGDIIQPKKLRLYKLAKIGQLKDERKQRQALKKYGYRLDADITNRERLVAYNPAENKTIFYEKGTDPTHSPDLQTDIAVLAGAIKQTRRYENAKQAIQQTHEKYKGSKFVDVGYSLGGNIVNYVAPASDEVYTINAGFQRGAKPRSNVMHIRVKGDPISQFTPKENTQTIVSKLPASADPLAKHYLPHIADVPVFL